MDTLIKADIFFFIASVESVIVTAFVIVLLYYAIRSAKILYKISEALHERFEDSEEFVAELRERLEGNPIFRFLFPPVRARARREKK